MCYLILSFKYLNLNHAVEQFPEGEKTFSRLRRDMVPSSGKGAVTQREILPIKE